MGQSQNPLITHMYKSYIKLLLICSNVSLSAFFVGYSLVYVGSLSLYDFQNAIINDYGFSSLGWNQKYPSINKSLIQGAVPVGAIFGALLSSQIIKFFSRKNGFLITNIPAIISIVLMVYIKNPYCFLIMRVIQGVCTGIYSAIVPLYINQIVTPDCSNLGSLNQIFIAFAQLLAFVIAFILHNVFKNIDDSQKIRTASITWKVISQIPIFTLVAQSLILLFVFPFETPKYLYENGLVKQGNNLVSLIYNDDHVDQAFGFHNKVVSVTEGEDNQIAVKSQLIGLNNSKKFKNIKFAVFFAIHLALLQQMSGVNAIAVYGKNTLQQAIKDQMVVGIVSLLIPAGPFVAAICSIKLMNVKGRKFLIQLGTLVCSICLGAVSLSFFFKQGKVFEDSMPQSIIIIIGMCIFMISFGLTLGPIVWLYIPEIVQQNIIPYSTMTNLIGATICIVGFPLISDKNQIKFIPFLFFFVWCLASLAINKFLMIETRNKKREQIFQQYRSLKVC